MSERKRKASVQDQRPGKKAKPADAAHAPLSISLLDNQDSLPPVLAVSLGQNAPALPMAPYARSGVSAIGPQSEMLLHSSGHPRLDFVANKDFANSSDALMDHYVGIYDPQSSSLRLIQANRLALRATLRPSAEELKNATAKRAYRTGTALREALGMEFGSKKAKKQIATRADNAVIGNSSRADGKRDVGSEALLESIAKNVASMPTVAAMNAAAEEEKPKPKANLSAKRPDLVYPIESLIAPEIMQSINVQDWIQAIKKKEFPALTSRFVQNRLTDFVISGDLSKIKVLRYMLHVITFFHALKSVGRAKRIPQKPELLSKMKAPEFLVEAIKKKFGREKSFELGQWELDNLITHLAAMSLFIDSYNTDTEDLRNDLRLERPKAGAYFLELGCVVDSPNEKEKSKIRLKNQDHKGHRMARLKIPLEFPKPRTGSAKRRN